MSRPLALTIALCALACGERATPPSSIPEVTELDGLRLDVAVDSAVMLVGDSITVTMRLTNSTNAPVRLAFGSTCQPAES